MSGMNVWPCRVKGRGWMRGSPVAGAPTSSSSGTPYAFASGSSSSRVGLRCPDSRRDRVLSEMPVSSASWASVVSRAWRSERSRGPTAVRTSWSSAMVPFAVSATTLCQAAAPGRRRLPVRGRYRSWTTRQRGPGRGGGRQGAAPPGTRRSVPPVGAGCRAARRRRHVRPRREGVPPGEPRAVRGRAGAAVDADPVAEETRDTVRDRRAPAPARPARCRPVRPVCPMRSGLCRAA